MYRHSHKQLSFEDFYLPFGGHLLSDNRWVRLSKMIPWEEVEGLYSSQLAGSGMGAPAFSVRMALGALIIKARLRTSDEETVELIQENPYLQYFLGLKEFSFDKPFDPSMFVHFRKRLPEDVLKQINDLIVQKAMASQKKEEEKPKNNKDDDEHQGPGKSSNKGKLILDATCAPADITYPTDIKLLNDAREKSEAIIDTLHKHMPKGTRKPRNYRQRARRDYLAISKNRNPSQRSLRKAIRKQLGYLSRNLKSIARQSDVVRLTVLNRRQYKDLLVIHEVYRQQRAMFDNRVKRIDNRIVSISQPHVRPLKRGKAGSETEFGAKISASLVEGYIFPEHISWDNFNESGDLIALVKKYKKRFGYYPESVHVDKIYRNRDNIKFCREKGIRLSGPRLGRPPRQSDDAMKAVKKQARQDELDRIPIEGKFGQGKRRFGLNRVMAKLAKTGKTSIIITFIIMNLEKWLKAILLRLFFYSNLQRINSLQSYVVYCLRNLTTLILGKSSVATFV
jgi:IS5 family transposase